MNTEQDRVRDLPSTYAYQTTDGGFTVVCTQDDRRPDGTPTGFTNHKVSVTSHAMGWKLTVNRIGEVPAILQDLPEVATYCKQLRGLADKHLAACFCRAYTIADTGMINN